MIKQWDPAAKSPVTASTDEYLRWMRDDLTAFQRTRPDLPQGDIGTLTARPRNQLIRAWGKEREKAELAAAMKISPEWGKTVERFQRTRTISFPISRKNPSG